MKDLPLESIHRNAFKAAEAVRCAADEGKGWEMYDQLFSNQKQLAPTDLTNHAQALGLDAAAFQKCLDDGKYAAQIRKDMTDAQSAGITGTPSFFLGVTDATGTFKSERVIKGAQPFTAFKAAIDGLLADNK